MDYKKIDIDLVRTMHADLSENFVALGMSIGLNEGVQQGGHSVIFVCLRGELKVFHFNNGMVHFQDASSDPMYIFYFHKKLDFIQTDESTLDAFVSLCLQVQKGSNLKFGYVFDGSFYDSNTGKHFTLTDLPELGTCVGFCINVLSSWIIEEENYLAVEDWETISEGHPFFMKYFDYAKEQYPEITEDNFKAHHRRITPNECTASAYFGQDDITIRKTKIDEIIDELLLVVANKDLSATA